MENWNEQSIFNLVTKQRNFFSSNVTLPIKWRIQQLKKLKNAIIKNEEKILKALNTDLGRAEMEAYFCDVGSIILELNETLRGLKRWSKPERHFSGLLCFPSLSTKVYKMPYGVTLIISPFNFPFLLSLGVLVAAIAGGNTAIIKASSKSKASTEVLKEIVKETFLEEYVCVVDGGHDVADMLLNSRFDKIFYTGSPKVGKHVMECASKNLTPVALELGGETGNWCIIRKDANLKDAAKKIAFFKLCNSGQICININQIAVAKEVADPFIKLLKEEIIRQIGEHPSKNEEYSCMIDSRSYSRCIDQINKYKDRVVFGGLSDESTRKIDTTILYPIDINDPIVQEELFNPILPIVPFDDNDVDSLLSIISSREHGLALYLFTKDIKWAKKVTKTLQFGGGCINEVCVHMMVKGVPFNGTGHSGMGAYHGVWGFREFTHPQTVLKGKTHCNLSLRMHPYSKKKLKLVKKFEK